MAHCSASVCNKVYFIIACSGGKMERGSGVSYLILSCTAYDIRKYRQRLVESGCVSDWAIRSFASI